MKALILGLLGLLITGSALADTTSSAPIHDEPGFFVHLDIDKVISQTDLTNRCGIVPARLDYLDHSGREHVMDYLVYGYGCYNDN
ncbi:DUF2790 domain-containing protein [Pseudomonas oryzihabitans]|uniref:DUF2790 domain-containing protein n=1 Tax=Pseudomonas oryzihabitans TaxID=47885 RepID=A0AAJ2BNP0_9PSED|nr:DUF2790 domain-containing protein [Pseudomonas psychrotolerans]MDR6236435.1 hypothetical protein [Pseudomonas psychrotolerans]MDR6354191.1 hypothetical protein [Pseudomonas psychrotolerans]MDR6676100.1 hypothetical protein [Pseudomonas psychrotolerans]